MTPIQRHALDHGLRPGGQVIQLEIVHADGGSRRELYRYDTGASLYAEHARRLGHTVNTARVEWDGVTDVNWYAGD